jgi:hypothetical protein
MDQGGAHPKRGAWARTGALIAGIVCGLPIGIGLSYGVRPEAKQPPPREVYEAARAVHALPPGPGGYGRDCAWRTEQVIRRLSRFGAHREIATAGHVCHAVAGIRLSDGEWIVDGQTGNVYEVRGRWAGPLYLDGCDGLNG